MKLLKFTLIINQKITSEYLMHKNCNMSNFVSYFNYNFYFLEVSCQDTSAFMTAASIHVSNWTGKICMSDFLKKHQWVHW